MVGLGGRTGSEVTVSSIGIGLVGVGKAGGSAVFGSKPPSAVGRCVAVEPGAMTIRSWESPTIPEDDSIAVDPEEGKDCEGDGGTDVPLLKLRKTIKDKNNAPPRRSTRFVPDNLFVLRVGIVGLKPA